MKVLKMLVFCLFLNTGLLFSQELTGTIRGVVTDQSGATIPKTNIWAMGPTEIKTTTDSSGGYVLSLVPGEYKILFEKTGFKDTGKQVVVQVGGSLVVNVQLELAGITETIIVNVEEKAPEIDTGKSTMQESIPSKLQEKIPSNSGFIGALSAVPGIKSEAIGGIISDGAPENDFYFNGVKISHPESGSLLTMMNPPREFMEETQVSRSSDARYDGALGAVVNGVLKRGGDKIHGQVWIYYGNNKLNASPREYLQFNKFDNNKVEYFQPKKDNAYSWVPGFHVGGRIKEGLYLFSGSRPAFSCAEREVTFLKNNLTGNFNSCTRQDFTVNKLDYDTNFKGRALQLYIAHAYSPLRTRGFLPNQDGTSPPDTLWHQRGYRASSNTILWKSTYFPTDKITISLYGGRNYTNFKDTYGLSKGPSIAYLTSNIGMQNVPSRFQASTGQFTPDNSQTQKDIYTRDNFYADALYLLNYKGFHLLRFGYQSEKTANDVFSGIWPDGRFLIGWGAYWPSTTRPGEKITGRYGFYIEDQTETSGKVQSANKALYVQDDWQIKPNLVLNLGLRTGSEYVPSYLKGANNKVITFGFTEKIAPRLGMAYDPTGSGKGKIFTSFSMVFDTMKNNLARSSFGADKWERCFYPLNNTDISQLTRGARGAFECLNLRAPANDSVDPLLKPMQQRMLTLGYERLFGNIKLLVYGINKSLVRTVEDVGRFKVTGGNLEEDYTITNPGEGRSVDPTWFPAGLPSPITPKAKRDYYALEARMEKRSDNHFVSATYTLSRFCGNNYSGLTSSDERGRTNPNTNRDYDAPYMTRDKDGKLVYGCLATDRPHVLKIFGYQTLKSILGSSDFGLSFLAQSGTPLSTQVPVITSTNQFAYGRGNMGRTDSFSQTDLNIGHDFSVFNFTEHQKIRLELTVSNAFNQKTGMDKETLLTHPLDGHLQFPSTLSVFRGYNPLELMKKQDIRSNPAYGMTTLFQPQRSMRIAIRYNF